MCTFTLYTVYNCNFYVITLENRGGKKRNLAVMERGRRKREVDGKR